MKKKPLKKKAFYDLTANWMIGIDHQVYERLRSQAEDEDGTFNAVLRKLLKMPPSGVKRGRPRKEQVA